MEPRPLTEQEKEWIKKCLSTLPKKKVFISKDGIFLPPTNPKPYLEQIDSLIVIDKCSCGDPNCHSIKFQHFQEKGSYAIAITSLEDGRFAILYTNEEGFLSELEVI